MSERPKTDKCPACGCEEDDGDTYQIEDGHKDFPEEFKRCSHCGTPFVEPGQDGHFDPYVEEENSESKYIHCRNCGFTVLEYTVNDAGITISLVLSDAVDGGCKIINVNPDKVEVTCLHCGHHQSFLEADCESV